MAQSLANVLVHLVFSTKGRAPLIALDIQPELHAYLAGVLRNTDSPAIRIGGVADHVHILLALGRRTSLAELVEKLKVSSTKWMRARGIEFAWQNGYGAFSIGESDKPAVVRYIDGQAAHHAATDFQAELRRLLSEAGIEFDERYLWD